GGYAIHGTNSIRQLGRPASHGCVRLHPGNAAALYRLVQSRGGARIVVTH
ncbi:MAG: L,D-transpeptidase, partial [Microvirga sp.]